MCLLSSWCPDFPHNATNWPGRLECLLDSTQLHKHLDVCRHLEIIIPNKIKSLSPPDLQQTIG